MEMEEVVSVAVGRAATHLASFVFAVVKLLVLLPRGSCSKYMH